MGKYDYELNTKLRIWAFIPGAREWSTSQLALFGITPGREEVHFCSLLL